MLQKAVHFPSYARVLEHRVMFGDRGLLMSPMTTKTSTADNMQPCLAPLPTTKAAERVPLCSTRHLAPLYVDLMTDTNLLGIPLLRHSEAVSIHAVKGLFKVYKNQMQIGTVYSALLDVWSTQQDPGLKPACSRSMLK